MKHQHRPSGCSAIIVLFIWVQHERSLDAAVGAQSAIFCNAQDAIVICKAALYAKKVSEDVLDVAILSPEADPAFLDALA
jgi:hypothetical protein